MPPEQAQEDAQLSLGETIKASVTKLESTASAADPTPAAQVSTEEVPGEMETPEQGSETEGAQQERQQGLERDESGKFKAKTKTDEQDGQEPAEKDQGDQQAKQAQEAAEADVRAPGSWRPALREKFAKLDPDVRAEILKREKEISRGFQEVGEVRKFRDHFLGTVNQYSHVINAEGGRPLETMKNLFQTANVLYTGTTAQKAMTVASIIKNFGVDINTLDEILSGQQPSGSAQTQQSDIASLVQQQVSLALNPLLEIQQRRAQQEQQEASQELEAFLEDPKNEFAYDVKDTMADLLEVAARRGEKMSLQTAYQRAILAHNDIAEVVARRKLNKQVGNAAQAAAQAKRRAVSLTGAPEVGSPALPDNPTISQALRAAVAKHSTT